MTRIALDAMGGDKAPGEIVRGGVDAVLEMKDLKVFLVGRKEQIEAEFLKFEPSRMAKVKAVLADGRLEVVHAPDIAEMDEAPVDAVRHKKDCSINVAMRLVKEGKAVVAFSMYPTTVPQLMDIADAGKIMPPKSTWFEPKLRDGLVTHGF